MKKLKLELIILAVSIVGLSCGGAPNKAESRSITVVSYGGGTYQQSHKDAFLVPFETTTATKVESVVWNAEYGKLKAMVQSNSVAWDVVEVTDAEFKRGKSEQLFQKLTLKPTDGEFLPNTVDDFGVANVYWGTVMAYRPESFPDKQPETWADFWDVVQFPGERALNDDPRGNLEFALLADGVAKKDLYPLDVDRAFRKLDRIRPNVRVWWNEGTQAVQLLQNQTVALSSAWNGRIYALEPHNVRIEYSWQGAALELDWWVIPKGSANVETASRFIAFASLPERLARQAAAIGYGPVNKTALNFLAPEIQQKLPTFQKNWEQAFVIDSDWWAQNEVEILKRWTKWKTS